MKWFQQSQCKFRIEIILTNPSPGGVDVGWVDVQSSFPIWKFHFESVRSALRNVRFCVLSCADFDSPHQRNSWNTYTCMCHYRCFAFSLRKFMSFHIHLLLHHLYQTFTGWGGFNWFFSSLFKMALDFFPPVLMINDKATNFGCKMLFTASNKFHHVRVFI